MHLSPERKNLFIPNKRDYVMGDKPKVDCILCSVVDRDGKVCSLEVFRDDTVIVSANLYPYNPGHLMICPLRHIEDIRDLTQDEERRISEVLRMSLNALEKMYTPGGFNVGYNFGPASGASIKHIHMHVVPRFHSEVGFLDILSGARIIVEDPCVLVKNLREAFALESGRSAPGAPDDSFDEGAP